jgi:mRNA interferase RelE/StbE
MLGAVSDQRVRQKIWDTAKRLTSDPEKQGAPLRGELIGFRDLRAVGQRYRIIYQVSASDSVVYVVAVGRRRSGARDDVYQLATKLVRLLERPPVIRRRAHPARKKK